MGENYHHLYKLFFHFGIKNRTRLGLCMSNYEVPNFQYSN